MYINYEAMIICQIFSISLGFARFATVPAFGMLGVNNLCISKISNHLHRLYANQITFGIILYFQG